MRTGVHGCTSLGRLDHSQLDSLAQQKLQPSARFEILRVARPSSAWAGALLFKRAEVFRQERDGEICREMFDSSNPVTTRHPEVRGIELDSQSRCQHYRGPTDIIAIKMECCRIYYACKDCHTSLAGHAATVWPESQWDERAILCGACSAELTIRQYMGSGYSCPTCRAQFNPGCRNHYSFYFESR